MGPAATADFLSKLVAATPATVESDYIPVVVWSDPRIPDRTAALLGRGPTPVPAMLDGIARLVGAGADLIAIPCNTAHAFLPELRAAADVEILDMIQITVGRLRDVGTVGILSTEGTRRAGLFAAACRARGLVPLELDEQEQNALSDRAIGLVKNGQPGEIAEELIRRAAALLKERGADVVIAGCTEIPLVAERARHVLPIVDATECLAEAAVSRFLPNGSQRAEQGRHGQLDGMNGRFGD
jgi:aspartate racemase